MGYQALYRKYRPQTFEDVKGQDVIIRTLRNQIRTGRIGHAYLFCGSRGTGKTTVAKIFAKAINCENLQDGDPCLTCRSCRAIADGASMNVIEMDAASRNSVDDFRQIIDEIAYPPADGRYKVYIIDEVHMLSGAAFNAFLKTLEEPPAYAVFILATTDPQKLPDTILSRCQRYDFHRISSDVIEKRLQEVLAQEQIEAEEKAVRYIARKAEGGMRDALSIMDQCVSFYTGGRLTYEQVLDVLGTAPRTQYAVMLSQTLQFDCSGLLTTFDSLLMSGRDTRQIIGDFTWYLRDLLLFKASGGTAESLNLTDEDAEELLKAGKNVSEDRLMYLIAVLSEVAGDLRNASNPRITAEVGLIRLCRPETSGADPLAASARLDEVAQQTAGLSERLNRVEEAIRDGRMIAAPGAGQDGEKASGKAGDADRREVPKLVAPELFSRIQGQWKNTLQAMKDPGTGSIMANLAEPWYNSSDQETLYVAFDDDWVKAYRDNQKVKEEFQDILEAKYGVRPEVRFVSKCEMQQRTDSVRVQDAAKIEGIDFPIEEED
ncbi:DNA polymerase III subunit gamma/tau [Porcincola intestinalis]|uniref:DNA polymerase III subunit gamma/tau n=1 Tax=Porcincola intestinalis TaxID=2606632 RepID=UPI0023F2B5E6|nr:DNA polymerase III subunit gamma/tau [Porcincola intestinalis]MCI6767997.1 DNA polymerase III subunit gamma/tau [Lachnospiraceae bacterium]MDD7061152.1 DNA polymerase III subunit gamma/tau [Porcincola intestinalis]MDY4204155.1 DNA polymerase III subunit gamma/tau [Porcincola intestinalis]MDY5283504.1 DNA polymerase III subunit gamma/tau [Porcincola intestinalis]MDY5579860.1 DNA polymerase III subunit gamma/tau [Porcincola intestinalis]